MPSLDRAKRTLTVAAERHDGPAIERALGAANAVIRGLQGAERAAAIDEWRNHLCDLNEEADDDQR
jgi:hypothetical protein